MLRLKQRFLWAIFFSGVGSGLLAVDDPPNFFVAPVRTDLQRSLIQDGATCYAMLNCNPLIVNGKPTLGSLEPNRFQRELKKVAGKGPSRLKLVLRYHLPANFGRSTKRQLQQELVELCRSVGIEKVLVSEIMTSADWREDRLRVAAFQENGEVEESPAGDELVTAYAVRTRLSRILVGDVDCIVRIKEPFIGTRSDLSETLRSSVQNVVRSLELGSATGKIKFEISCSRKGRETAEKLFHGRLPPPIPADLKNPALLKLLRAKAKEVKLSQGMQLARQMGFDGMIYSLDFLGGAPELVGQAVADFSLESLAGEKIKFSEFRENSPALLTFWGVACAPCCLEAPHLTKLHQKYAARGFKILAVNSYDESQEKVARYVESAGLSHPMALNGSKVAKQPFLVEVHPTSFWIGRDGKIKHVEVGYSPEKVLEQRIVKLLESK